MNVRRAPLFIGVAAAAMAIAGSSISTASASPAWTARGPGDDQGAVALGGGFIDLRDRGSYGPYLEFQYARAVHHNFDLEVRAVTTGATFVEGGGRVRWGLPSGAFSVGARIGAIAGVGSSGPFAGMYPGALVSFGSQTVQGTLGLDVWLLSTDRYDSATQSKSQTVFRSSAGVELAVSDSTWLYLRVLWFARTHRAFADGSPTLVLGVTW